jgi:GxxExxY protein
MGTLSGRVGPAAELTQRIIGCAFRVHGVLGSGFMEKVYENAMVIELRKAGLAVRQQAPMTVWYQGQHVGEYFADLLVDDEIVCELKAGDEVAPEHEMQLVNYLAATGKAVGLLINFGKSVSVKRKYRVYAKLGHTGTVDSPAMVPDATQAAVLENPVNPEKSC